MNIEIIKARIDTDKWVIISEAKNYSRKALSIYREHYNLVLYTGEQARDICKEIESRIIEKTEGLIIRLSIQITNEFISNFPNLK